METINSVKELGSLSVKIKDDRLIEAPEPSSYLHYLHKEIDKVKQEMTKNVRTSAPLSLHDIAFSLPRWVYPAVLWKQNARIRRKRLNKFFSESQVKDRMEAFGIQAKAEDWAKSSDGMFKEELTLKIDSSIEELFSTLQEFISVISHDDFLDLYFVLEGCGRFENKVQSFLENSNSTFQQVVEQVNRDFDSFVSPSGGLRVILESIRYDAIKDTKNIRDQWYKATANNLMVTSNEIQSLLSHIVLQDANSNKLLQTKLKTISQLQSRLKKKAAIYGDTFKYKKETQSIWNQVVRELHQTPWQVDYWTDAFTEVKEAATDLVKSLYKFYKGQGFSKKKGLIANLFK